MRFLGATMKPTELEMHAIQNTLKPSHSKDLFEETNNIFDTMNN